MTTVIGVRFKKAGKVYYFDPREVWPKAGDWVVVETSRGVELGEVITGAREVEDDQIVAPLKQVIRVATSEDMARAAFNASREPEALRVCQERVEQHKLEMKLVDVEYTFDGSKIIFYFTANGRVDFRELVKDLASVFKMRIELRQIGVRDEAKMLGGLGACGRQICCDAFLGDFQPVSIKMAKEQNLSLNPTKISGQCGRLMCCLKYEQDYYDATLKKLPKVGREALTPDGYGVITDINPIREKVRVRMRTSEDNYEVREYALEEVTKPVHDPNQPERVPEPRLPKPVRKPRDAKSEAREEAAAAEAEERQRRRLLRPKGPKQASTDEYFDNLERGEQNAAEPGESDTEALPEAARPDNARANPLRREAGRPPRNRRGPKPGAEGSAPAEGEAARAEGTENAAKGEAENRAPRGPKRDASREPRARRKAPAPAEAGAPSAQLEAASPTQAAKPEPAGQPQPVEKPAQTQTPAQNEKPETQATDA